VNTGARIFFERAQTDGDPYLSRVSELASAARGGIRHLASATVARSDGSKNAGRSGRTETCAE